MTDVEISDTAGQAVVLVERSQERVFLDLATAAWEELQSEWGGLLFGRVFVWKGLPIVWVGAVLPGFGRGTPVSFELDPASFVLARRLLGRAGQNGGLTEVGFWHSHPNLGAFASGTDREYHGLSFPQPGSVSIIVDPFAPAAAAYVNTGAAVVQTEAYDVRIAGEADVGEAGLLRTWDLDEVRRALS